MGIPTSISLQNGVAIVRMPSDLTLRAQPDGEADGGNPGEQT